MARPRVLRLTTPPMTGEDVKRAQNILLSIAPGTKYGNYKPGPANGIYGERTAAATKRAKYWLGYAKPDDRCGPMLLRYLTGKTPLTAEMQKRRKARLDAYARPLREKAFNTATSQLGTKEDPPGSNRVKYSAWYGLVGPWCAMFVTWCYDNHGSKAFQRGSRFAYTPYMVIDAREGKNGLVILEPNEVKRGDIVMFDWEARGRRANPYNTDHVGLFDEWITVGKTFKTIEGNTAIGNDSNGGQVLRRDRRIENVSAFIRAEV